MKTEYPARIKLFRIVTRILSRMGLARIPAAKSIYSLLSNYIRPKGEFLVNVQGNKMYVDCNTKAIIGPRLVMDGVHEQYTTELLHKMMHSGMVVADIGANIGYYTLVAAKLVGEQGIIYAFEPEPSNYELLCKNIRINGYTNIVPVPAAASNISGKARLYLNTTKTETASLADSNIAAGSKDFGCVETETVTLDEFLEKTAGNHKLDFIKMDVQGAEGLVIDGAERVLRDNDLKMVMEFDPDLLRNMNTDPHGLLEKLRTYGFEIKLVDDKRQTLESIDNLESFCQTVDIWHQTKSRGSVNLLLEKH